MKEVIQSSSNKTLKHIKALRMKKYRDEQSSFVIEGEKLVLEAMEYKAGISMVLCSQSFAMTGSHDKIVNSAAASAIPVYYAEDRLFKDVCETESPQGIIAVAVKPEYRLADILDRAELCLVLLNEIRDPGNAGTIIRTADACGLDAVLLSSGSVDLYNGKTIRSTMGSLFHIPVLQGLDAASAIEELKKREIVTIGADPHSDISCIAVPYYKKSAIIVGNESQGISSEIKGLLDTSVKIPMPGRAESLNAGIAASIMMYEFSVRKKHV
ncbi:MAG TPA: RNA methyltransferase [Clostridia bacterium]|nr:RNA methyltransferase [Clostridia bacterium]